MTRVRSRRLIDRRGDFARTVAEEVALGVVVADYHWPLSLFLLPQSASLGDVRRAIETAREHEASMWRAYPDGPESIGKHRPHGSVITQVWSGQ